MSSTEKNKQLVVEFMQAFSQQDFDHFLTMMTEEGTWEIMGDCVLSGLYSKSEFADACRESVKIYPEGIQFKVRQLTAEEDRVVMESWGSAKTADGRDYKNVYHQLFIVKDGKIKEVREYLCTKLANDALAPSS